MSKVALVTGANRGIGFEFVKQLKSKNYYVIACCRQPKKANQLEDVANEIYQLDITNDDDILSLRKSLNGKCIDLLVNNAGIAGVQGVTVGNIGRNNFIHVMNVNCISTIILTDALLDNIKSSEDKSILVVTSSMGSISENERGRSYAYRSSKTALNCVMRSFAIDVYQFGINVMLIHPGWVKTDLGGDYATINVETSVYGILNQMELFMKNSHAETIRTFDGDTISW